MTKEKKDGETVDLVSNLEDTDQHEMQLVPGNKESIIIDTFSAERIQSNVLYSVRDPRRLALDVFLQRFAPGKVFQYVTRINVSYNNSGLLYLLFLDITDITILLLYLCFSSVDHTLPV